MILSRLNVDLMSQFERKITKLWFVTEQDWKSDDAQLQPVFS